MNPKKAIESLIDYSDKNNLFTDYEFQFMDNIEQTKRELLEQSIFFLTREKKDLFRESIESITDVFDNFKLEDNLDAPIINEFNILINSFFQSEFKFNIEKFKVYSNNSKNEEGLDIVNDYIINETLYKNLISNSEIVLFKIFENLLIKDAEKIIQLNQISKKDVNQKRFKHLNSKIQNDFISIILINCESYLFNKKILNEIFIRENVLSVIENDMSILIAQTKLQSEIIRGLQAQNEFCNNLIAGRME